MLDHGIFLIQASVAHIECKDGHHYHHYEVMSWYFEALEPDFPGEEDGHPLIYQILGADYLSPPDVHPRRPRLAACSNFFGYARVPLKNSLFCSFMSFFRHPVGGPEILRFADP